LGPCTTLDWFPVTTQIRAFLWQDGRKDDLGTLGGDDASANLINDLGMVGGESYTNTTPNPSTGVPTQNPFLWVDGKMLDLGTLGGTYGYPNWLNFWGQVVGRSNLAGDQSFHPFLWEAGAMHDLGTFGGATGSAWWINDAGEIAGYADLPTNPTGCSGLTCVHHAFLWRRGVKTDLGTVGNDLCSRAFSINLYGHLVGESASVCGSNNTRAALWRDGVAYDLNALIPPSSDLTLQTAWDINDRDEIAGDAVLSTGEETAFLLIPCDGDDPGGCTNPIESTAMVIEATARITGNSASMKEGQSAARAVNPYSNQIGSRH
jgi:probable HAF family extracellular repeat protein